MGQYKRKWSISLVFVSKLLIIVITAILESLKNPSFALFWKRGSGVLHIFFFQFGLFSPPKCDYWHNISKDLWCMPGTGNAAINWTFFFSATGTILFWLVDPLIGTWFSKGRLLTSLSTYLFQIANSGNLIGIVLWKWEFIVECEILSSFPIVPYLSGKTC